MNKVSKRYMVATIIEELNAVKELIGVLIEMEKETRSRVDIIGHNTNEFAKLEKMINNLDYLLRKDEYIQNMSFWNRLRFLIVGKI